MYRCERFERSVSLRLCSYIIRRLILGLPVLILISAIVFLVTYLIPGDPAMVVLGQGASPDALEAVRHRLGLDEPVLLRYFYWLRDLLQVTWASRS